MNSAIDSQGAVNPKLPLWATICLSYSTYFYSFRDVLRISWLWLVVAAPLTGVASWETWSWMARVAGDLKRGMPPQIPEVSRPIEPLPPENVASLVLILAGISIAVAWHRRIILGEHPRLSGSNVATKSLWRYVGVGLAICLIVILSALLIALLMFLLLAPFAAGEAVGRPPAAVIVLIPVILLLGFAAFAVMLRLSVLLPARAVGDLNLTFKETWDRTRGNTWRMFWGIMACTLLPMLAAQIAILSLVGSSPDIFASEAFVGRMALGSTISMVYYLLILPIGIGFLSLSYRHFFERA
jgi:hypothetical protein